VAQSLYDTTLLLILSVSSKTLLCVCFAFLYQMHTLSNGFRIRKVGHKDSNYVFGLKFADDIHYKFKSSQASKARLQSSKHTGTKQNLTQNGDSRSFKVTCFGVSGKAIRH